MGVFVLFLASYLMDVGPCIRVLAPDWSRLCFGLVRCHGHVGSYVAARRHVAWCGWVSPSSHDVLCISLSSRLWCMQMIYPFRSSWWARRNGAGQFGIWGCIWWCHIYAIGLPALNYTIPCAFTCVLQQKIETPKLVEIVSINPYSSVDDHFPFILCRNWQHKSGTWQLSTTPIHLTFACPKWRENKSMWDIISRVMKQA
jgi:hypothetical protein